MKKILTLACLTIIVLQPFAQQVARDRVVVEVATGTWCQYCPGAAMGIDDLIAAGYNIAPIKYHGGDNYANPASNYRISYYNISGYPTAYFDGSTNVVGGSSTQSMFGSYVPHVNQRNNVPSSFTLAITGSVTGNTFDVTVEAIRVAPYSNNNLRLHVVLTESHIPEYWQGQPELNFVERMMIPDHLGTALDFSTQTSHQVNLGFTVPQDYEIANCHLVAFLQNNNTREITQGTQISLADIIPNLSHDLGVRKISNVPPKVCHGSLSPVAVISNHGSETITQATIHFQVNGGTVYSQPWTGSLPYLGRDTVQLTEGLFTPADQNTLSVFVSSPNGQTDLNPGNDTLNLPFVQTTAYFKFPIVLVLKTDDRPQETTWELTDHNGNILFSGGPYTEPNKVNIIPLNISEDGCYRFVIHDTGGDGICCTHGNGLYKIADANNQTIHTGNSFLLAETVDFMLSGLIGTNELPRTNLETRFNETGKTLTIQGGSYMHPYMVSVFDMTGRQLFNYTLSPAPEATVSLSGLSKGLYLVSIRQHNIVETIKIVIR